MPRECANAVDNSGAAAIIGLVSGLCLDSEGAPATSDSGSVNLRAAGEQRPLYCSLSARTRPARFVRE
jgi:hypothetical protein